MGDEPAIPLLALYEIVKGPQMTIKGLSRILGITDRHASRVSSELASSGQVLKERTGKETVLRPATDDPVVRSLQAIASSGWEGDPSPILSVPSNLRLISGLASGSDTIDVLIGSIGCSRSSLYRMLDAMDRAAPGLVVRTGKRRVTLSLGQSHALSGPLSELSRVLYPVLAPEQASFATVLNMSSVRNRILVHLLEFPTPSNGYSAPFEVTQKGISQYLDILQGTSRVANHRRKEKVYHLTLQGVEEARSILERMGTTLVRVIDLQGVEDELPLGRVHRMLDISVRQVDVLNRLSEGTPLALNRLKASLEARRERDFISGMQSMPLSRYFYGREREKAAFTEWINGDGGLLVVKGGPGQGKTSFVSRMLAERTPGWLSFSYTLSEWSTPRGFLNHLAIRLKEANMPHLRGVVDHRRDLTGEEVSLVLERSLEGLRAVLVVDDVHKLGPRMAPLLDRTIKASGGSLKVIMCGRGLPDGIDASGAVTIDIEGLDMPSACTLLTEKGAPCSDLERIYSLTKGNPLALELIGGLDTRSYNDLATLIDSEIVPNLSSRDLEVLGFVSVLRYPFHPDVLRHLFHPGEDGSAGRSVIATEWERKRLSDRMEDLSRRSFLTYSGDSYRLHDLFRDLLYRTMDKSERERYHLLASRYYLSLENDPARVEALYHLACAFRFSEAIDHLGRFGPGLTKRGYASDLGDVLSRIDPLMLNDVGRIEYHFHLAEVLHLKGDWDGAISNYNRSLSLCDIGGRPDLKARSKLMLARLHMTRGASEEALSEFEEAISLARGHSQFILESSGVRQLGSILYLRGEEEKARSCYARAMEIAQASRSKECLAHAHFLGSLLSQHRRDHDRSEFEMMAALRIYDELGDSIQKLKVINNLAWLYSIMERWDQALKLTEELITLARSVGDFQNIGFGLLNSADILIRQGGYDEAERRLRAAYRHFVVLDDRRLICSTDLTFAVLYKARCDVEKARVHFLKAIEGFTQGGFINQLPELYCEFGEMESACGDRTRARSLFMEGLEYARRMNDTSWAEKLEARAKGT